MDQHALAGPHPSGGVDQVVRRRRAPAEAGGRPHVDPADGQGECGGRQDHLGAGALGGQRGNGLADAARVDALADRDDLAGSLEAGGERAGHGKVAVADHGVPPLDPGIGDPDRHLTGAGEGFRRAGRALMGHHEAVLRGYGLTMTQYTVLLALSREGGMSGAQLARACGVTQQSMGSVLANLDTKQLIARAASPTHAKVQISTLTETGRALLDRAYQEVIILERALTETFTPAEHASLVALLERATAVLARQTRHAAPSA